MKNDRITTWLVFILIILVAVLIILQLRQQDFIEFRINSAFQGISITAGKDGKDGYTPVKGIDYFDGVNGYTPIKNVDYFDGYTPVKGVDYFDGRDGQSIKGDKGDKGDQGEHGRTPSIRCNVELNQWEVKYEGDEDWTILGEEPVKCTVEDNSIVRRM